MACHSLEPGRHRTGPSLAGIWGKKAGNVEGFRRYSNALKEAEVVWDESSLDAWLGDPRKFIPGNRMIFRGIADRAQRTDLIAYLRRASEGEGRTDAAGRKDPAGGMMRSAEPLKLTELGSNNQITAMRYCGDTYTVSMKSGEVHQFWEFNMRFKSDSSEDGPRSGHPVLIPAGMMGDRVFVVFSDPKEISDFIRKTC